jgi:hypothetical protein
VITFVDDDEPTNLMSKTTATSRSDRVRRRGQKHRLEDYLDKRRKKNAEANRKWRRKRGIEKSLDDDRRRYARERDARAAREYARTTAAVKAPRIPEIIRPVDPSAELEEDEDDDSVLSKATAAMTRGAATLVMAGLTSTDTICQAAIGFTRAEFTELVDECTPFIDDTTDRGMPRMRSGTESWTFPVDLQLFIFLFWLRQYLVFWLISFLFRSPRKYLFKIIHRLSVAMGRWARSPSTRGHIHWSPPGTRDRLKHMSNFGLEFVDVVFDGIHIHVHCPKSQRGDLWASWEKAFCVCVIVGVDLQGRFVYLSPLQRRNEEQGIIKNLNLRSELLARGLGALGDAKFCFNTAATANGEQVRHAFTVGPTTLRKLREHAHAPGELGEFCRLWLRNTKIASQNRIVVENSIGRARQWKVIEHAYRALHDEDGRYTPSFDAIVLIVLTLTQRQLLSHPCRGDEWVPAARKAYEAGEAELRVYNNEQQFPNSKAMSSYLTKLIKANEAVGGSADDFEREQDDLEPTVLGIDALPVADEQLDSDDEEAAWAERYRRVRDDRRAAHRDMFHDADDQLARAERFRKLKLAQKL